MTKSSFPGARIAVQNARIFSLLIACVFSVILVVDLASNLGILTFEIADAFWAKVIGKDVGAESLAYIGMFAGTGFILFLATSVLLRKPPNF